jgi:hypothetical protein
MYHRNRRLLGRMTSDLEEIPTLARNSCNRRALQLVTIVVEKIVQKDVGNLGHITQRKNLGTRNS